MKNGRSSGFINTLLCSTGISGSIFLIAMIAAVFAGWGLNVYKLTQCDFEAPYKSVIIRVIGIPVFVLGGEVGWMELKDGKPVQESNK